MTPGAARASAVAVVCLLLLAASACSSSDSSSDSASTATSTVDLASGSDSDDTDSDESATNDDGADEPADDSSSSAPGLELPESVTVSEVSCSSQGSIENADGDSPSLGPVPCDVPHDTESITLTDADDLDDCYRAIGESSDVVIVVDADGELDFEDDRVTGHTFGGFEGEYECQISLAETRTDPLIDR